MRDAVRPDCHDAGDTSQSIQAGAQPEYHPATPPADLDPPAGNYASWDEFRILSPAVQLERMALATRALPDLHGMEPAPIPECVANTDDDLGCPIASLILAEGCPRSGMLTAQRILYLAILGASILLIAVLERHGFRLTAIGVGIGVGGLAIALWSASLYAPFQKMRWHADLGHAFQPTNLWLFENGILWQHGAQDSRCRWEDIEEFEVNRDGTQPRYRIAPRRDVAMELSLACTPAIVPLAEYMEIKITSAQLLPKLRRIVAGERVRFGVVVLDAAGFASPNFAAPWSELIRVIADRSNIFVDRRGQPAWHAIPYHDVSCPLLVCALAHILIADAQRLPPSGT